MLASPGCTTKTPDSDGTLGGAAWPGISSRTVVRRPARYFLGRRRSDTHSVSGGRISGAFGPPDHTRHKPVLTTIRAAQLSGSRRAGSSPLERWPSIVRSSAGQRGTPAVPEARRRAGTEQGHRSATGSRRLAELPPNPRAPQFCDLRPQAARGATRTTRAMRRECSRRVAPRHRNLTHRACGTGATPSSSESSCPAPGARRAASSARHPMVRKQRPVLVNRNCSRLALPR